LENIELDKSNLEILGESVVGPYPVIQTIPDAEALIVTTPQEIALADVRKSINFCRQVDMEIIGIIENMSGFACPHCKKELSIFGINGGAKMAAHMRVSILGKIPIEPEMVDLGDKGELSLLMKKSDLEINRAYGQIIDRIEKESKKDQ